MPDVEKHPQGRFCWLELHTTDRAAASAFYTALFGWTALDIPMGAGNTYTTFQLNGRSHGAASQMLNPAHGSQKPAPNWQMFVAVDSADEMTARAIALGADSPTGTGDVGDFGRMSIIRDPSGAVLSLWQAKRHKGLGIIGEPGAFCWAEHYTTNAVQAKQFYSALFGWTMKDSPEYTEIHGTPYQGNKGALGGILQIRPEWGGMPPCWVPYFQTTDCAASVEKAKLLGGKCLHAPKQMEGVGTIAMLADPQGAGFWLFQPL